MKKRAVKKEIVLFSVLILLAAVAEPTVSVAPPPSNVVYFVPQHGNIIECPNGNITVELRVNTTDAINNWNTYIEFDPDCINITGYSFAESPISHVGGWTRHGNWIDIGATKNIPDDSCISGDVLLATLTIDCKACDCSSPLNFIGQENIFRYIGCAKAFKYYAATWYNGTVTCGAPPTVPEVVINEFMANPSVGDDWVELYNPTENTVCLSGWTLNNSSSQMKALSGNISAGGYLVVDVNGRLNKDSDSIILLKDGMDVDNVTYGAKPENAPVSPTDKSTGRYPNGIDTDNDSADFRVFDVPTPGAPNTIPPATPFLIFGWVNYSDGSPVNNPSVTITNLNTTEVFTATTDAGSNYYQVLTSSDNVSTGNVLHFEASNDNPNTTEFDHTVTEGEMNKGGIFDLNITIEKAPTPTPTPTPIVSIGNFTSTPGETVSAPILINNVRNYGTGTVSITYNPLVVQVTAIENSSYSTVVSSNIDNSLGTACISAWNTTGVSGDIIFAYVTFKAVGPEGSTTSLNLTVSEIEDIYYNDIPAHTVKGSFKIKEGIPPLVGNPTATPSIILNDNGRARVPGTNVSQLNVSIADASGVCSVTINLTPILGPGHDRVPMSLIEGNNKCGIWSVTTTANYDPGVGKTHCLHVNATDIFGNSNTDKCILLTVLRRGDVVCNNRVDIGDAYYIARYTVGLAPEPNEFVAGVVPADSYDGVDMSDALYIARYTVGLEPAP